MAVIESQLKCIENKKDVSWEGSVLAKHLVKHIRELQADTKEQSEEKSRLAREIDVALSGEENAAEQASLCDLIGPARDLRAQLAAQAEEIAGLCGAIASTIAVERHADTCGTALGDYPCNCWKARLNRALKSEPDAGGEG